MAAQCSRNMKDRDEKEGNGDDDAEQEEEQAAKEALLSGWRRALRAPRPPPRNLLLGSAWPPRAPPDVLDAIPDADMRAAARALWAARPPLAMECAELAAAFCGQRCDARQCFRAFGHMRAALVALRAAGFGDGCTGVRQLRVYIVWVDRPKQRTMGGGGGGAADRGPTQANGGLSFGCSRPEILVYRREEWWKVFLHEAIHALGADFSARARRGGDGGGGDGGGGDGVGGDKGGENEAAERNALAAALFPGAPLADTQHLLLNEAFTEVWARLWHLAWTAVQRAPGSRRRQRRVFDRLLAESRIFAAAQAMRWLAPDHVAMLPPSEEETAAAASSSPSTITTTTTPLPPFQEDTAGLMYFVLAAALLCRPSLSGQRQRCTSVDPNSECARIAVAAMRSRAFARSRRLAVDLLPPTETSTRMTHVDAAPDDDDDDGGGSDRVSGGGRTRRKSRRHRHHRSRHL